MYAYSLETWQFDRQREHCYRTHAQERNIFYIRACTINYTDIILTCHTLLHKRWKNYAENLFDFSFTNAEINPKKQNPTILKQNYTCV